MSRKPILVLTAVLLATSFVYGDAEARRRHRVGVVPVTAGDRSVRKAARKATRKMTRRLRRNGYRVVTLPASRARRLQRCMQQPNCAQALARKFRVRFFVATHAERVGRQIHVDMRVVNRRGVVVASKALRVRRPWGIVARGGRTAAVLLAKARRFKPKSAPAAETSEITTSDAVAASRIIEARDTEDPDAKPEPQPTKALELKAGTTVAAAGLNLVPVVRKDTSVSLWSRRYWHAWTAASLGVAALSAGAVFGTFSRKANKGAQEAVHQPGAWTLQNEAEKNALAANISFAVGGAAMLTSAVLFYLEYRQEKREKRRGLNIGVNVAQDGGQLTVQGRF